MPKIRALSSELSSQIAAGEVIERPASIVKELLENSLDAQATQIDVVIEAGGMGAICVQDNGCGIAKEDMLLAFSRHATSKIHHLSDLERIQTLGFRGEALASIASVSRVDLTSREKGGKIAWHIQMQGLEAQALIKPSSRPEGTYIAVRDLFFNIPARRKFLRSPETEFAHILRSVHQVSLSRFDVGFSLRKKRALLQLPQADTEEKRTRRVAKVCGERFIENAWFFINKSNKCCLSGWIGLPTYMRSQADLQYFYVNGRFVRDKRMMHAVRLAYRDVQYRERQPAYVLYLTVDPSQVDVNVHPTKSEVRFSEARQIHHFLVQTIRDVLAKASLAQTSGSEVHAPQEGGVTSQALLCQHMEAYAKRNMSEASEEASAPPCLNAQKVSRHDVSREGQDNKALVPKEREVGIPMTPQNANTASISIRDTTHVKPEVACITQYMSTEANVQQSRGLKGEWDRVKTTAMPVQEAAPTFDESESTLKQPKRQTEAIAGVEPLGYAIGKLHGAYILAQNRAGLVVVDIHAAHERILYERLKISYDSNDLQAQTLCPPITFQVSEQEAISLKKDLMPVLAPLKFQIDQIAPTTFAIRAFPVLLQKIDIVALVRDVLSDWDHTMGKESRVQSTMHEILGNMACKSAVQVNCNLNLAQMNTLLRDMEQTDHCSQCNHGRPTYKLFPLKELDRFFLRGR